MDWKPSWPMSQIRARSPPRSSAQRCEFSEGQSRGSFRIGGAGLAPFFPCRPLGELSRRTCGAGGIPAPPRSGARRWGRSARLSGATIPHWCAEGQGRPENQCSGRPEARCKGNSEVRFGCRIKRWLTACHTAPQRGAGRTRKRILCTLPGLFSPGWHGSVFNPLSQMWLRNSKNPRR